ncbi:hypothetical protein F5Y19DRAFT_458319 [Xylariaceae sp. FL1651]|nr:hypothetical protein F5Y19DRAFT_458319 [Xylariaceae sp. FL1651]
MGVVEKGNVIYIPADKLTSNEVTVEWQQSLSNKTAQYYSVPFFNKTQGNEESVIFIQKTYLDALKNKKVDGDDLTVIVDDSFQYGQNKEKTKRWLAYHDKNNKAYQWRFVATVSSKLGSALATFGGGLFKQYVGIDLGAIKGFFGDYLHNF